MANKRRIAVIGAGVAGIMATKHLVQEGLEPVCFEKTENYGGTWFYRKESSYGQASIMPTTVMISSKEIGAFSDFPPKKDYHNHLKHTEVYNYITDYINHNDLHKYIHYKMEIMHVKKPEEYIHTGQWYVTVKNLNTGVVSTEIYDGVLVAIGHDVIPKMEHFPGQEKFTGKIIHTHSLKAVEEFEGQNVLVVGMGTSGLDAAVESSRVAKQVYLSTRFGALVMNRVAPNGYPMDYVLLSRILSYLWDCVGTNIASWYVETLYIDRTFDYNLYQVKPQYHFLCKDPIVNDQIGQKLLSCSVIQKSKIKCFTEKGVLFEDDDDITNLDTVIMATGYGWEFPFLEDGILDKDAEVINLYKCMYPPHLPHPTLAILGFILPYGPFLPVCEIQCRWAAYLLAGYGKLPSKDSMCSDVLKRHAYNKDRFLQSEKMTIRVDYVRYLDEMANLMGVKPNLLKYVFMDFSLFIKLFFGPCLPYQFRLEGHGKWQGARDAIMSNEKRFLRPVSKKKIQKPTFSRVCIDYLANLLSFLIPKISIPYYYRKDNPK